MSHIETPPQTPIQQATDEQIAIETNRLYHEQREAAEQEDAEYRKIILGIRTDTTILKQKIEKVRELKSSFHTYLAEYMRRINAR